MNKHVKMTNMDTDSDHDLILSTVLVKGSVRNLEITKRRNFSNFNKDEYLLDLMGLKWSNIYNLKDPTLIDSAITENIFYFRWVHWC